MSRVQIGLSTWTNVTLQGGQFLPSLKPLDLLGARGSFDPSSLLVEKGAPLWTLRPEALKYFELPLKTRQGDQHDLAVKSFAGLSNSCLQAAWPNNSNWSASLFTS